MSAPVAKVFSLKHFDISLIGRCYRSSYSDRTNYWRVLAFSAVVKTHPASQPRVSCAGESIELTGAGTCFALLGPHPKFIAGAGLTCGHASRRRARQRRHFTISHHDGSTRAATTRTPQVGAGSGTKYSRRLRKGITGPSSARPRAPATQSAKGRVRRSPRLKSGSRSERM